MISSPDYTRISLAAAITLGLKPGRFYRSAKLYCINLLMLYPNGCLANCQYCGQAREISAGPICKRLIRVEWPTYELDLVIERTKAIEDKVKRVCLSMITHPKAREDFKLMARRVVERLNLPLSGLITPTLMRREDIKELHEIGVDMIGIAIDAATPELFDKLRGKSAQSPHSYNRYLEGIREAVEIFGEGKVGAHYIVGLGETEEEMVKAIQLVKDMGAFTHLFSFYPEVNSPMQNREPPPIDQYRRIQLARYLIDEGISRYENMKFNSGKIVDFGVDKETLIEIIESGKPFETSGCPGCNRPFANERPGQPIRNFPFPPTKGDIALIRRQLGIFDR